MVVFFIVLYTTPMSLLSTSGSKFDDETFQLAHTRGVLSMANAGKCSTSIRNT